MDIRILGNKDVVSVERDKSLVGASTFRGDEIYTNLRNRIAKDTGSEIATEWVLTGLPCEVLIADGRGWQSGKVWFCLEFIPDDPEVKPEEAIKALPQSPLADLRSELLEGEQA